MSTVLLILGVLTFGVFVILAACVLAALLMDVPELGELDAEERLYGERHGNVDLLTR